MLGSILAGMQRVLQCVAVGVAECVAVCCRYVVLCCWGAGLCFYSFEVRALSLSEKNVCPFSDAVVTTKEALRCVWQCVLHCCSTRCCSVRCTFVLLGVAVCDIQRLRQFESTKKNIVYI